MGLGFLTPNLAVVGWTLTGALLLTELIICTGLRPGGLSPEHMVGNGPSGLAAGALPLAVAFSAAMAFSMAGLFDGFAYWGAVAAFVIGVKCAADQAVEFAQIR